jgi:hypothetical protein
VNAEQNHSDQPHGGSSVNGSNGDVEAASRNTPPPLPDDPHVFWSAAVALDEFDLPAERPAVPPLERLGPSPFPRSGFPLIGFLATVYDHVANFARSREHHADHP